MSEAEQPELHAEYQRLVGAVEILTSLREEMEQWLEEAQDDSKQETLENVVGHLGAIEEEYKGRRDRLSAQVDK